MCALKLPVHQISTDGTQWACSFVRLLLAGVEKKNTTVQHKAWNLSLLAISCRGGSRLQFTHDWCTNSLWVQDLLLKPPPAAAISSAQEVISSRFSPPQGRLSPRQSKAANSSSPVALWPFILTHFFFLIANRNLCKSCLCWSPLNPSTKVPIQQTLLKYMDKYLKQRKLAKLLH